MGHLLHRRRAADLAHRHLAEREHKGVLPLGRQRLPNWMGQPIAHRGIQASAPRHTMPEDRISATRRVVSNYQRCLLWDIECGLRDSKDLRFGMGMGTMRVNSPERRDRLWLLNASAVVLLTLLGAAGEALGYDRLLKSNTAKRRTHSLFRQGSMLYELMPNMPEERLLPLVRKFVAMLAQVPVFAETFGIV